jgi:hypothetical protein
MNATATALEFAARLDEKFATAPGSEGFAVLAGRKYDKVVQTSYGQRSVHAFVERATGQLYKAAGWNAPAKGARYDLSTEESFKATVAAADQYGSYLYR